MKYFAEVGFITLIVIMIGSLIYGLLAVNDKFNEDYINAMIEADNAYRAAINEPKQCKQTLNVCWEFLNHKLVTDVK